MTVKTAAGGVLDIYADVTRVAHDKPVAALPRHSNSMVADNMEGQCGSARRAVPSKAVRNIEAGATFGGVVGAGAGFLIGIGLVADPGMEPMVAAEWLAATAGVMTGAFVGAAAGGLVGCLTDMV